jgi:transposase
VNETSCNTKILRGETVRCEEPVTILEILIEAGHSQRQIAASVSCSKSTVGEIQRRCRQIGLCYEQALLMTNDELKSLVYPLYSGRKIIKPDPDFDYIHSELKKHPNLNLQYMWEEYRLKTPDGLSYSQFCVRYKRWKSDSGQAVTMHIDREPGKEMFVDWMGDKLRVVVSAITGETFEAHFFVSTLGFSGYPYVEAFPDEKQHSWQRAHINAFSYYGGTSLIVIPDNCKTAVSKPSHYDPVINPAYWELAKHYNVAVIPARIREPQDKSPVETSIGWLETWLLGWLRNQIFFSFAELNKAILSRLGELVKRPFQARTGSRLSNFIEFDRPNLRPLPLKAFEMAEMLIRTVPDNYHVEYDGYYYSVPFMAYRQKVTIRATATTIEIFDTNRVRIASHQRRYSGMRYTTDPGHMPEHHRRYLEARQFDGDRYRSWAKNIGLNTAQVIDKMLKACKVEEQAYKSCMGLLQLSKKYGDKRLEAACLRAISLNACNYTTVANILKNGQDTSALKVPPTLAATPAHANVRGASYYS